MITNSLKMTGSVSFGIFTLRILSLFVLVACSGTDIVNNVNKMEPQKKTSCPILNSENWQARLRAENDTQHYLLKVTGAVTLPTPAYIIEVQPGPLDRRRPPSLTLNITAKKPDMPVMQVLTTEKIQYEQQPPLSHYRRISIFCEGKKLGEIADVMTGEQSTYLTTKDSAIPDAH